jgi:putative ABC transport system ATP-binding protein
MMALLAAHNLTRQLGGRQLWQNLSFELEAGEALAVRGPSGSGKTLLLRTLAGLDNVSAGQIYLHDKAQSNWLMPHYRAQVMYLAQRPALPEGTVAAALEAPFSLAVHRHKAFSRERILDYLKRVNRSDSLLASQTADLSGGEGQLVALMRVLQLEPTVLLLDEPSASLDDDSARALEQLLKDWLGQAERACLWTSHNPAQLERMTTKALDVAGVEV